MSALIDDWDAALREPGFWTAHFRSQLRDSDRADSRPVAERLFGSAAGFDLERLFGPDLEAMNEDGLIGDDEDVEARGGVLTLVFPGDHRWSIEYLWDGVFHDLGHESRPEQLSLGYDDPHFHLPILRWPELFALAARGARFAGGREVAVSPGRIAALLAPVTWATSEREAEEARGRFADLLADAGITAPGAAREAARQLVVCVPRLAWRPDPALGWVNDGNYSHRNPHNGYWTPVQFARFRRFVEGSPRPAPATPAGATGGAGGMGGAAGREPVWRSRPGGPVGPALAVDGDTLVCTTWPGTMHAVDARTGRPRWRAPVPEPGYSRAAPLIADDLVYYAGGRHTLDLVCVSRWGSGEPEVTFALTLEPRPSRVSREPSAAYAGGLDVTPVIGGGTILVGGRQLHARWLGPTGPQMHWDVEPWWSKQSAAPTVAGGLVYGAGRDYRDDTVVQAVDLASGSPAWRSTVGKGAAGRPVVDGGELFVPAGALHVLDPRDGAPLWTVEAEREWRGAVAVTPAYVVGTACRLAAPDAGDDRPQWCFTVLCVDRRTRGIAWTFTAPERLASAGVVVADGTVYSIGHDDAHGTLYAVDLATGRLRWRADLGRTGGLPAVAGGLVHASTMDGVLAAFEA